MNTGAKALQKQRASFPGSEVSVPKNTSAEDRAYIQQMSQRKAPTPAPTPEASNSMPMRFPYPPGSGNSDAVFPSNTSAEDKAYMNRMSQDILSRPGMLHKLWSMLTGQPEKPQGMMGMSPQGGATNPDEASDDQNMAAAYGLE